jgi:hypothetical protein
MSGDQNVNMFQGLSDRKVFIDYNKVSEIWKLLENDPFLNAHLRFGRDFGNFLSW